jgi:hypothetical protein
MHCRSCNKSNFLSFQMKKEKGIVNKGICLTCASEAEKYRLMRIKVDSNPAEYIQCNDCDRYFKKSKAGRSSRIRVECLYCSSKNIESLT